MENLTLNSKSAKKGCSEPGQGRRFATSSLENGGERLCFGETPQATMLNIQTLTQSVLSGQLSSANCFFPNTAYPKYFTKMSLLDIFDKIVGKADMMRKSSSPNKCFLTSFNKDLLTQQWKCARLYSNFVFFQKYSLKTFWQFSQKTKLQKLKRYIQSNQIQVDQKSNNDLSLQKSFGCNKNQSIQNWQQSQSKLQESVWAIKLEDQPLIKAKQDESSSKKSLQILHNCIKNSQESSLCQANQEKTHNFEKGIADQSFKSKDTQQKLIGIKMALQTQDYHKDLNNQAQNQMEEYEYDYFLKALKSILQRRDNFLTNILQEDYLLSSYGELEIEQNQRLENMDISKIKVDDIIDSIWVSKLFDNGSLSQSFDQSSICLSGSAYSAYSYGETQKEQRSQLIINQSCLINATQAVKQGSIKQYNPSNQLIQRTSGFHIQNKSSKETLQVRFQFFIGTDFIKLEKFKNKSYIQNEPQQLIYQSPTSDQLQSLVRFFLTHAQANILKPFPYLAQSPQSDKWMPFLESPYTPQSLYHKDIGLQQPIRVTANFVFVVNCNFQFLQSDADKSQIDNRQSCFNQVKQNLCSVQSSPEFRERSFSFESQNASSELQQSSLSSFSDANSREQSSSPSQEENRQSQNCSRSQQSIEIQPNPAQLPVRGGECISAQNLASSDIIGDSIGDSKKAQWKNDEQIVSGEMAYKAEEERRASYNPILAYYGPYPGMKQNSSSEDLFIQEANRVADEQRASQNPILDYYGPNPGIKQNSSSEDLFTQEANRVAEEQRASQIPILAQLHQELYQDSVPQNQKQSALNEADQLLHSISQYLGEIQEELGQCNEMLIEGISIIQRRDQEAQECSMIAELQCNGQPLDESWSNSSIISMQWSTLSD